METRSKRCLQIFTTIYGLLGDIIELGCSSGHTTIELAKFIKEYKLKKKIYAYDTFEGLPYQSGELNADLKKGECKCSLEQFNKNIIENKVENIIIPVKGLIEDTLKSNVNFFCFAWFDLDLYESTLFAYKEIENKIVHNGIIGFHDYGFFRCPGIKKIVDNDINKDKFKIYNIIDSCIFLKRI
jgi:SAM-dependent methyltransferase